MADHIQIGDISPRIQYTGDGAQTAFTYPFPIFVEGDIEVYDGTALQLITADYTVSGAGQSSGGTVTFEAAPAADVVVTLKRNVAIERTTDFQQSGEFRAKVINDELDRMTAEIQQVDDSLSRSLRLKPFDTGGDMELPGKDARANMYLGFDANGDPIATDAAGPTGPTGPAGNMDGANNLSELTDPAAARSNLSLGDAATGTIGTDVLAPDGDGSALTGIQGGATASQLANIILNTFRIAVNGALSIGGMIDGWFDIFVDETGVDLGTAEGTFTGATNNPTKAFGDAATGAHIGLMYETAGGMVTGVKINVDTVVTPFNCACQVYTDSAGSPGVVVGGESDQINLATTGDKTFTWSASAPTLSASTNYWFVFLDKDLGGTGNVNLDATNDFGATYATGRHNTVTSLADGSGSWTEGDIRVEVTLAGAGSSSGQTYDAAGDFFHNGGATSDEQAIGISATHPASGSYQYIDRSWALDNNKKVIALWFYGLQGSMSGYFHIYERTSAGTYDVYLSGEAFTHTNSGWEMFTLSTPFDVPASGDFYVGWWSASPPVTNKIHGTTPPPARSWKGGAELTGTGVTFSESSTNETPPCGARYLSPAVDMTLVSAAQTANAVPTDAVITLWHEAVDSVTLNTDLTAEISRDGGVNWTSINLSVEATLDTGKILTGTGDLTAQPSGTSMVTRIKTLNSKEQKVRAIGPTWS